MTAAGVSPVADRIAGEPVGAGLEFLWLELTNRCNLKCVHDAAEYFRGAEYQHDFRLPSAAMLSAAARSG